jgi:hypothetical protein
MEDRETPRLRKYGESKMTQIMMATVPHLTAWAGRTKYYADGFLFDRVYKLFKSDQESWKEGCSAGCLILSLTDEKIGALSAFVHSDWQ